MMRGLMFAPLQSGLVSMIHTQTLLAAFHTGTDALAGVSKVELGADVDDADAERVVTFAQIFCQSQLLFCTGALRFVFFAALRVEADVSEKSFY